MNNLLLLFHITQNIQKHSHFTQIHDKIESTNVNLNDVRKGTLRFITMEEVLIKKSFFMLKKFKNLFKFKNKFINVKINLILMNNVKEFRKKKLRKIKKRIKNYFKKETFLNYKIKIKSFKIINNNKELFRRKKIINSLLESDLLSEVEYNESRKDAFNLLENFRRYVQSTNKFKKRENTIFMLINKSINDEVDGISYSKGGLSKDYSYGVIFREDFDDTRDILIKILHEIFHLLGSESDFSNESLMNCFNEKGRKHLSKKSKEEIANFLSKKIKEHDYL